MFAFTFPAASIRLLIEHARWYKTLLEIRNKNSTKQNKNKKTGKKTREARIID